MDNRINTEKFCQYFFYGFDNKEQIIKGLIEQQAILQKNSLFKEEQDVMEKNKIKKYKEKKGQLDSIQKKIDEEEQILKELKNYNEIQMHKKKKYALEILLFEKKVAIESTIENEPILFNRQVEKAARLLVQFKRFINYNDDPYNEKYVFHFNDEIIPAKEEIKQQLKEIRKEYNSKKGGTFYIDYAPFSGIFYIKEKPVQELWVQEVIQILECLQDLEKNNIFQYYSTFLDVKYARAIHRIQIGEVKDDKEKNKIKDVYKMLLKRKASFRSRY